MRIGEKILLLSLPTIHGMAKEQNIPYFGVYVDGSNSKSNLPKGLERNRTIQWNWDNISNAIDQLMKEGKNAK